MVTPTVKNWHKSSRVHITIAKKTCLSFITQCDQLWLTWAHFLFIFSVEMHNNCNKLLHLQLQIDTCQNLVAHVIGIACDFWTHRVVTIIVVELVNLDISHTKGCKHDVIMDKILVMSNTQVLDKWWKNL